MTLSPRQRQVVDGWIAHLSIDLERAQAALRLPASQMPIPPTVPERGWSHGWWDDEFAEDRGQLPRLEPARAVARPDREPDPWRPDPASSPARPAARSEAPPPSTRPLRGAYARRARKEGKG